MVKDPYRVCAGCGVHITSRLLQGTERIHHERCQSDADYAAQQIREFVQAVGMMPTNTAGTSTDPKPVAAPSTHPLYCSVCWPLSGGEESDAPRAVSIVDGNALCSEHMLGIANTPQTHAGCEVCLPLAPNAPGLVRIVSRNKRGVVIYDEDEPCPGCRVDDYLEFSERWSRYFIGQAEGYVDAIYDALDTLKGTISHSDYERVLPRLEALKDLSEKILHHPSSPEDSRP